MEIHNLLIPQASKNSQSDKAAIRQDKSKTNLLSRDAVFLASKMTFNFWGASKAAVVVSAFVFGSDLSDSIAGASATILPDAPDGRGSERHRGDVNANWPSEKGSNRAALTCPSLPTQILQTIAY
jgi:hypothetical protein